MFVELFKKLRNNDVRKLVSIVDHESELLESFLDSYHEFEDYYAGLLQQAADGKVQLSNPVVGLEELFDKFHNLDDSNKEIFKNSMELMSKIRNELKNLD